MFENLEILSLSLSRSVWSNLKILILYSVCSACAPNVIVVEEGFLNG